MSQESPPKKKLPSCRRTATATAKEGTKRFLNYYDYLFLHPRKLVSVCVSLLFSIKMRMNCVTFCFHHRINCHRRRHRRIYSNEIHQCVWAGEVNEYEWIFFFAFFFIKKEKKKDGNKNHPTLQKMCCGMRCVRIPNQPSTNQPAVRTRVHRPIQHTHICSDSLLISIQAIHRAHADIIMKWICLLNEFSVGNFCFFFLFAALPCLGVRSALREKKNMKRNTMQIAHFSVFFVLFVFTIQLCVTLLSYH